MTPFQAQSTATPAPAAPSPTGPAPPAKQGSDNVPSRSKPRRPIPVRRGFHRLGLVGLVPLVLAAGVALLIAAHIYTTGKPYAVYVVKGPDGRRWEWKDVNVTYPGIREWLSTEYGKQIQFGSDGVDWPSRYPARREAWDPAVIGLGLLAVGAFWYGICWTVAWVIAGFQREGV